MDTAVSVYSLLKKHFILTFLNKGDLYEICALIG